jgi:hypothetical protein
MTTGSVPAVCRLREGLKRNFGPGAAIFVDPFLWLCGYVSVDIVRLDNWLMRRHSDYRKDESMRNFVRRKYGRRAERFIKVWLKGESRIGTGIVPEGKPQ